MATFALVPPGEIRPSLLVQVVAEVSGPVLAALREQMYLGACSSALAIDSRLVHVLYDNHLALDDSSINEEAQLDTERLLGSAPAGEQLEARVERWLRRLASRWDETLPRESWIAPLLQDVVPAASGSVVQRLAS